MRRLLLASAVSLLCICAPAAGDTPLASSERTLVIAHRGNSSVTPENTLSAFRSAVQTRADYVELDARASADGTLYCLHDETLDRTTDAKTLLQREKILLRETPDAVVSRLDAGQWFDPQYAKERVPTLAEALDVIQAGSRTLLERKDGPAEAYVRLLREKRLIGRVVVQSFDWEFLKRMRELEPRQPLGALGDKDLTDERLAQIAATGAGLIGWKHTELTGPLVADLHRRGYKVWAWTADVPLDWQRLIHYGVDGIITNCPGRLARELEASAWTRIREVTYGRKHGAALTLDVFQPKQKTRAAVIFVVSGGWHSAQEMINVEVFAEFLRRGYTVFAVVHGSQPKFTIPEAIEDLHRSVRFIRYHAKDYDIDPGRIAIAGCSAGGHLSLMIGTAGRKGDPAAKDPVDRQSSRVQAVGCYFPPTDFLNYAQTGRDVFKALEAELAAFKAPFDFQEFDQQSKRFVLITGEAKRLQITREISPVTHVTADDPPTLIIHGDADKLVPFQQAQAMHKALEKAGVPVKLVVRPGQGHGWPEWIKDMAILADWFDKWLERPSQTSKAG